MKTEWVFFWGLVISFTCSLVLLLSPFINSNIEFPGEIENDKGKVILIIKHDYDHSYLYVVQRDLGSLAHVLDESGYKRFERGDIIRFGSYSDKVQAYTKAWLIRSR